MRGRLTLFSSLFLFLILCSCYGTQASILSQESIEVYFSPGGGAQKALIERFEAARSEILVAMYIFTNQELADALIAAHEKDIRVNILLDGSQDERAFSRGRYLHEKGVTVRVDRSHMLFPGESQGIMHNKYAIIDSITVITGSYNWTQAAEIQNDENLFIIDNAPDVAVRYVAEFEKLWQRSVSYDVKQLPSPLVIPASDLQALRASAGQKAYVQGVVHDVYFSARSETYFVNFGPDRSSFTGVIFKSAVKKFTEKGINPKAFEKRNVEVYGKIIDHPKYGLEIIIEDPVQVKFIKDE